MREFIAAILMTLLLIELLHLRLRLIAEILIHYHWSTTQHQCLADYTANRLTKLYCHDCGYVAFEKEVK